MDLSIAWPNISVVLTCLSPPDDLLFSQVFQSVVNRVILFYFVSLAHNIDISLFPEPFRTNDKHSACTRKKTKFEE